MLQVLTGARRRTDQHTWDNTVSVQRVKEANSLGPTTLCVLHSSPSAFVHTLSKQAALVMARKTSPSSSNNKQCAGAGANLRQPLHVSPYSNITHSQRAEEICELLIVNS